ncbi:CDGP domain-containing protein (plasmid) [Mycolicibacterium aichiense]|uniref:CDGP domain-containing protein n=1 Tax=Mycolicibacterium aichiense TaxID=1799 RepID=UPI003D670280
MKKQLAVAVAVAAAAGISWAPVANADVHPGCQNDRWGFLGTQTRTICDGPKQADGSWVRYRMVWIPPHEVPISTSCGTYSCSTSGGYWQDEQDFEKVKYPVTPDTVVPGEPDWLPPRTPTPVASRR